jgi:hypothetical protein
MLANGIKMLQTAESGNLRTILIHVEQRYGVLTNRDMTMTYDILQRLWLLVLLLVVAPLEREHCRRIAGVTTVPGVVYRAPYFRQRTPY